MIVLTASKIGAKLDLTVADGRLVVDSKSSRTVSGGRKQHPVAMTKVDNCVANASKTPAWASFLRCASSRHVLVISAAAKEICCWTVREEDV